MFRLAIAAIALAPGLLQAQNTSKISGTVTDALTHQPIQNAHVTGFSGAQRVNALTLADGSYVQDGLQPGTFNLSIILDGYRAIAWGTDRNAQVKVGAGESVTRDFVLHPLARISGRLVDRDTGDPIDGHAVSAMRKNYGPGHMFFEGTPATVKSGDFDVRNLEPGDYLIQIDSVGEPTIDLSLNGAPKKAAAPEASPQKYYGPRWYPDVPGSDMAAVIHLGEGETRSVRIALQSRETHSISGTVAVSDEAPRGFESLPVSLGFRPADSGVYGPSPAHQMPAPGPFSIHNISPGTYRLAFSAGKLPNRLAADYTIEIGGHDIENFKVVLTPEAGVSGEFRMLEKDAKVPDKLLVFMVPVSGWLVIQEHATLIGGNMPVSGFAAELGKFHQESIRPGEYWPVPASLPKGYAVAQVLFQGSSALNSAINLIAPATPLSFVLTSRPGAVAVTVHDENQAPVPGVTVVLLPDPLPGKPGPGAIRTGESGGDGAYVFPDVAPGNYRAMLLTASDPATDSDIGYLRQLAARNEPFEVRAGQAVSVNLKR